MVGFKLDLAVVGITSGLHYVDELADVFGEHTEFSTVSAVHEENSTGVDRVGVVDM
jgi:hypothetical protein